MDGFYEMNDENARDLEVWQDGSIGKGGSRIVGQGSTLICALPNIGL